MAFPFTQEKARLLLPLITALANGETIQLRICGQWSDMVNPSFNGDPSDYRVKPEEISINGFVVPGPLRQEPERGSKVYLASATTGATGFTWAGNVAILKEWIRLGLLHSSKEAAELHVKALRSFTETPET